MVCWITPGLALVSAVFLSFSDPNFSPANLSVKNPWDNQVLKVTQLRNTFNSNTEQNAVHYEPNNEPEVYQRHSDLDQNPRLSINQPSVIPSNCKWTPGCDAVLSSGQEICNSYKLGWYAGKIQKDGCGRHSALHLCCKATPGKPKLWTKGCYSPPGLPPVSVSYTKAGACIKEFGLGSVPTGNAQKCSGYLNKYECTN